jgi:small subunit ribosomal protein S16
VGAKKQPHYRVVVADSSAPREGRFIEVIGTYNPRTDPPEMQIDAERAVYWLGVGAQPTEAVQRMLDKLGIIAHAELAKPAEARPEVRLPIPEPVTEEEEGLPLSETEEEEEELPLSETEEEEEELPLSESEEGDEEFEDFEPTEGEEEDLEEIEDEDLDESEDEE